MDSFQGRAGAFFRPTVLEFDAHLMGRGLGNFEDQCVIWSARAAHQQGFAAPANIRYERSPSAVVSAVSADRHVIWQTPERLR
jgi:hypothetical protein